MFWGIGKGVLSQPMTVNDDTIKGGAWILHIGLTPKVIFTGCNHSPERPLDLNALRFHIYDRGSQFAETASTSMRKVTARV